MWTVFKSQKVKVNMEKGGNSKAEAVNRKEPKNKWHKNANDTFAREAGLAKNLKLKILVCFNLISFQFSINHQLACQEFGLIFTSS